MKKVLLSLTALFAFGLVSAQDTNGGFANGDLFISGTVGFSNESTGDVKSNGFTVSPRLGYFVSENIAVGVSLGYTSTTDKAPNTEDETLSMLEVGAFGRYYFTPANKFSLFGQLGVAYASNKWEQGDLEAKSNGFNIGLAPGINYFVSDHLALEATFGILGYSTDKPDTDGAESTDTFEFGVDMSNINFGIVYKF
ncbi:porin family protein [Flavobacterium beibuense]|uniref:Putative outer membrane protein n=1 Tax=Flavobacterium beibuense TaxID=657326 RepID=A0A444WIT6_9FLAO|nr:porin family protein [Flavobacterium beibuense]RYJ45747.1 putative outer membrane protein [Flavobacterium beibuense]